MSMWEQFDYIMLFMLKQVFHKFIGLEFFLWTYLKKNHLKLYLSSRTGAVIGGLHDFFISNSDFYLSLRLIRKGISFMLKVAKKLLTRYQINISS